MAMAAQVAAHDASGDSRDPSLECQARFDARLLLIDDEEHLLDHLIERRRRHAAVSGEAPHEVEMALVEGTKGGGCLCQAREPPTLAREGGRSADCLANEV